MVPAAPQLAGETVATKVTLSLYCCTFGVTVTVAVALILLMLMVWLQVAVNPAPSVAVQVIVVIPNTKGSARLVAPSLLAQVTVAVQLSLAVVNPI